MNQWKFASEIYALIRTEKGMGFARKFYGTNFNYQMLFSQPFDKAKAFLDAFAASRQFHIGDVITFCGKTGIVTAVGEYLDVSK